MGALKLRGKVLFGAPPQGAGLDYSTSEQDTGMKWVDGKTIFQKTISLGTGLNANSLVAAHGITSMGIMVELWGTANVPGTNYVELSNSDTTSTNIIRLFVDGTNVTVASTGNWASHQIYVTLRYTKTT